MEYKIGDKVKTEFGVGEILYVHDIVTIFPYLVGIKGYDGHSGEVFLTKEKMQKYIIDKDYENQCEWFDEDELKLIKEE